jgi:hypothetical protein
MTENSDEIAEIRRHIPVMLPTIIISAVVMVQLRTETEEAFRV